MSSRYLELSPSNKTTDNLYSFKKGVAQITFDIPAGNYLLDPDSVRISGSVRLYKDSAGTVPAANHSEYLNLDSRLGIWSVMQQVIWRSSKFQTTLEHNRHYNRWLSSYLPVTAGQDDTLGHLSQSALVLPNYELEKRSVVDIGEDNHFCVHMPCGLLRGGNAINLMENALGGLSLTIMLESDSQVLNVDPADATTPPVIATYADAMYELKDVKLLCSVITPPPDQLSQLMKQTTGSLNFQTIHSYYDTANSMNIQSAMNFGLSKVKSMFVNIIASQNLNNFAEKSFATLMPMNSDGTVANVKNMSWLKGGTTYPRLYPVDTNYYDTPTTSMVDPVVIRDFLNAIASWDVNKSLTANSANTTRCITGKADNIGTPYYFVIDGGPIYGWGVNFENYLGGSGINLTRDNFGFAVDCDLLTNNAQSLFYFVNAESNVVWNQNGVQVLQ